LEWDYGYEDDREFNYADEELNEEEIEAPK
jgi:hypothetical protein